MVHPRIVLPALQGRRLLNQIKTAAGLNAVRSFAPLEGQIHVPHGDATRDIRVTLTPIQDRESAHLRFLTLSTEQRSLSSLGLQESDQNRISDTIHTQSGLVLVTGGTGSGKTTTMYSLAASMDLSATTAFSIEDPVEFKLPYAQQIEVDERHGLTMYEGLRTILRMDPDLILIGEIRDRDSAVVAARAALSGKLVLATIHAQDAPGAVDSLHYLSVPCHIIGTALRSVIAQNLVRKLCNCCAQSTRPSEEERSLFSRYGVPIPETVKRAAGCVECNSYGYRGRTGIFEIMTPNPECRQLINRGVHHDELTEFVQQQGTRSVAYDGLTKVAEGVTSMDELQRVCQMSIAPALEPTSSPDIALPVGPAGAER
jgi:type II secretory ATPase GspE/PulE/Tfp pilus assembly ATPase PilB-like protein